MGRCPAQKCIGGGKTCPQLSLHRASQHRQDTPGQGIRCEACQRVRQGAHPDVTLVEPQDGRLKSDQVRGLQRELALSPYQGRWRVCIITEFQWATPEAANALLKTLEEPPARAVLLLTATDASLLLPTIVSRCQVVPLRAVPEHEIKRALMERWRVQEPTATLVARLAAGRIGWAIRAMEDPALLASRREQIEELLHIVGQGPAARLRAAEKLAGRQDLADTLRLWQSWWRDLMLLGSGCAELVVNLDYEQTLRQQAQRYDLRQAKAAVRSVEAALQQLEQNVNPRLALEVLLLGWQRARP